MNTVRAEKVWIDGFGDDCPMAHFARAQPIKVKSVIRMIPIGGSSVPEKFASIRSSDAVPALAFGRRIRMLRAILQSAVPAGVRTMTPTDRWNADGPGTAEVTLRCRTNGLSYFESLAAPVSVINYLCMAVAGRIGEAAVERLPCIDGTHARWGDAG